MPVFVTLLLSWIVRGSYSDVVGVRVIQNLRLSKCFKILETSTNNQCGCERGAEEQTYCFVCIFSAQPTCEIGDTLVTCHAPLKD